jgi:hypothetical protein
MPYIHNLYKINDKATAEYLFPAVGPAYVRGFVVWCASGKLQLLSVLSASDIQLFSQS